MRTAQIKVVLCYVLILFVGFVQAQSFEESLAFLEDCSADDIELPQYDNAMNKFTFDQYLSGMSISPCTLENFDDGFKVFCINETFHSIPVSKLIIPFETDSMMYFGIVFANQQQIDDVDTKLREKIRVKKIINNDSSHIADGQGFLYRSENGETMLLCKVPEL